MFDSYGNPDALRKVMVLMVGMIVAWVFLSACPTLSLMERIWFKDKWVQDEFKKILKTRDGF